MVEFALFKPQQFIGANLVAFIITFAMMGAFFFMALYMQDILGYGALEAGIRFLPTTLVIVVGRAARRPAHRPHRPAPGRSRPACAGLRRAMFLFSTIDVDTTYAAIWPPSS